MKQLLGVLLFVGVVVTDWPWFVAGFVVVSLVLWAPTMRERLMQARAVRDEQKAALIRRADQQTAWANQGDPRGWYGDYTPAAGGWTA